MERPSSQCRADTESRGARGVLRNQRLPQAIQLSQARDTDLLQDDAVHGLAIMQWLLPSAEFSGGWALIVGFLSVLAAFGLFAICFGALAFDAVKRIRPWQPIDRADWLGDLLYVPEALYCIGLTVAILAGPGPWSLDARITALLAG